MSRIAKFISGVVISSVLLCTIASAKVPPSHISDRR
ncbi:putative secreted protein [[Clostridium] cellulosi]|uniref:Putative secreted protein n=1 Tax=[Clostridium] cellulosi TaxID=29343 RepID=A0A078KUZ8_9FIRM|nr:putative secreted protein [[Clostridium] cellulosi]